MALYLLDTDVVSALMAAPVHKRRSIAEINRGIALLNSPTTAAAIKKALD